MSFTLSIFLLHYLNGNCMVNIVSLGVFWDWQPVRYVNCITFLVLILLWNMHHEATVIIKMIESFKVDSLQRLIVIEG
jgi:hypothetical protein